MLDAGRAAEAIGADAAIPGAILAPADRTVGRGWRRHLRAMLATAAAIVTAAYAAILVIDPYDCLWFSPRWQRAPVADSQRYAFAALARSPRFDSVVLGDSTVRHLPPVALEAALGGRFANLAMDNGLPYEQSRLLALFARTHAAPRTVIIGLDRLWCEPEQPAPRTLAEGFPDWLYDDGRWNKLNALFNRRAFSDALRQLRWMVGAGPSYRDLDGFQALTPDERYDFAKARLLIYGPGGPRPQATVAPPFVPDEAALRRWSFPDHRMLATMLAALPAPTRKVLIFVPYHVMNQPPPGSAAAARLDACKRSVTAVASPVPNAYVLDFMIPSAITEADENYWDGLHYRLGVGMELAALIGRAVGENREVPGYLRYLAGPAPAGDGPKGVTADRQ